MPHYRERDLNCQAQNIAFALDFVNRVCDNYITASRNLGSDMMTKDRILEVLKYTPETGVFVWKISTGKAIAGRVAGQETKHGYVRITIDRRAYMAHRLVWACEHGSIPSFSIDHIDGNKKNNRIENLRQDPYKQNSQNIRTPGVRNTSGFLGVVLDKKSGKWRAFLRTNKKTKALGRFATPEQASEAYLSAKRIHHVFCTI